MARTRQDSDLLRLVADPAWACVAGEGNAWGTARKTFSAAFSAWIISAGGVAFFLRRSQCRRQQRWRKRPAAGHATRHIYDYRHWRLGDAQSSSACRRDA